MKKTIYDFERKYEVQDELLNEGALEGIDERTLHETIKAMLINTIKDCIKYENWMDPDMTTISKILFKEKKTEDDMRKIKNAQDKLRNSLHFSKIRLCLFAKRNAHLAKPLFLFNKRRYNIKCEYFSLHLVR